MGRVRAGIRGDAGLSGQNTEVSAQYVDHNLLQTDFKNADDHLFLLSACKKFGVWYSRPGNGVSHPVHMERFGKPGRTLLGSDSHTPAAGSLGMLAMGAGGLEVALAMAGEPVFIRMPSILGVRLSGRLSDWVPIAAGDSAGYEEIDETDLSDLEPLIALPSSPDNVVPVREVAGRGIYQAYIGSSAPGFFRGRRDQLRPGLQPRARRAISV